MSASEELVDSFFACHSAPSEGERRTMLDDVTTEDVVFHGLEVDLTGRDELAREFISGGRLVRTGPVDGRGEWIRWRWELLGTDDEVVMRDDGRAYAGVAVARVVGGRLTTIVPFVGAAG